MTEHRNKFYPPASTPSAHLDDTDLVTSHPSTAVEKHLADCAYCRGRRDAVQVDEAHFATLLNDLDNAVPVASGGWQLTSGLRTFIDRGQTTTPVEIPHVDVGQLWRLSWRGRSQLAVIISHDTWRVLIAPLSTDIDLADEYTLLLDAHASALETSTALFLRARVTVPTFTLETFLGDVWPGGTTLKDAAETLIASHRRGRQVDQAALPTGRALERTDFDKLEHLTALQESMAWFESAVLDVTDTDGSVLGEGTEPVSASGGSSSSTMSVPELLNDAAVDFEAIASASEVPLHRLLDLAGGTAQPTADERSRLAAATGREIVTTLNPVAVTALIEAVGEPRLREAREQRNRADNTLEIDTVRPLIDRLLHQPTAARSVSRANEGTTERTAAEWRAHWDSLLAMMLLGRK